MFGKLMTIASKLNTHTPTHTHIHMYTHTHTLTPTQENLPDAGKAQDFMKKFNQVLGEDEKLRLQLDTLISPTCSCKQAEICVVSNTSNPNTHP